jgi:hypothetical protein
MYQPSHYVHPRQKSFRSRRHRVLFCFILLPYFLFLQTLLEHFHHIPLFTAHQKRGYLEDRRPAANMDPYLVTARILETVCLN